MQLLSIQVGQPKLIGRPDATDPFDKEWTTGFFKEVVSGPVAVGRTNLAGDGQADLRVHGGPDKAINAYPQDHWAFWQHELALTLPPGAFGENFTTKGMVETGVCIGDVFQIGTAVVQISQPRQPCWKLARRWRIKDLAVRVEQTGRTGWYFRVLVEGQVEAGQELQLTDRPHPQWTVHEANQIMHHRKTDWKAATALAACPALSASWQESLARRTSSRVAADPAPRLRGPDTSP